MAERASGQPSNVNAGQTVTVEEGKGFIASQPYGKPGKVKTK